MAIWVGFNELHLVWLEQFKGISIFEQDRLNREYWYMNILIVGGNLILLNICWRLLFKVISYVNPSCIELDPATTTFLRRIERRLTRRPKLNHATERKK